MVRSKSSSYDNLVWRLGEALTRKRNLLAAFASLLPLAAAMLMWGDLFLWAKVLHIPDWLNALPAPLLFPAYLAFLCLLPAALLADELVAAGVAVALAVLVAPLFAVAAYALQARHQDGALLANMAFHYCWIVLFFCVVPALLVLLFRAALDWIRRRRAG